jgi:succinate dehydrogenase / fumarate reductase, membrane anchor subunit
MTMETPLAEVRGLGAAHDGAQHWWVERLTSLSTLLLFIWFLVSVLRLPDLEYRTVTEWLAGPLAAVPMLLLIVSTFWHLKLGMQVAIEDYVHEAGWKFVSITLLNFLAVAGAAFALFAVLRIALAGAVAHA